MKLFKDSRGFILSFGWDMVNRTEARNMVCWCDPKTKDWNMAPNNQAGNIDFGFHVAPEFIFEVNGKIVAYQPGVCIELTYAGGPFIWSVRTMLAQETHSIAA